MYGITLRTLRKKKGITLQTLASGVCSVSFLSKFERGESDISLHLMTSLLEKLMISFEEFLFIHHDYSLNQVELFFKRADTLYLARDLDGLALLKEEQLIKWQTYGLGTHINNALLLEVYEGIIGETPKSEEVQRVNVQRLSDYLFGVEEWGYYELSLYSGTMLLLEPDMVITLSKTAYFKSVRFREYEKITTLVTSVLLNTVIYLLGPVNRFKEPFKYTSELNQFFNFLDEITSPEQRLIERLHVNYLKGIFQMRVGRIATGTAEVESTIQLLHQLKAPKLADNIAHYLRQIQKHM